MPSPRDSERTEGVDDDVLQQRFQRCATQTAGTELDLSNLQLTGFPVEILTLFPSLRRLNLRQNALESIPDEFPRHLTHLVSLNLSYNALTRLPDHIGKLRALQKLSLSHNQLSALPSSFIGLHALEELDLSFNSLQTLDGDLGSQLLKLKTLNLAHNQLLEIPRAFVELMMLRVVDLSGNDRLLNVPDKIRRLHERNVILHSRAKRRELISRALRVRYAVQQIVEKPSPMVVSPTKAASRKKTQQAQRISVIET
ncbi:hypothetical protein Poli38472_002678 [Pythium oligandrum]|uniref:Uncharacterized protein n=1 Tax=Pythium oligandrum TaxID=41045 RepID=A0A8K1FLD6_PYTOL|nr:hypothetical protein Poli38472_002678 [Pythium oligandrum]|eukprot:TMW63737.1 hypothetical protein Poli38472_002678 [Pythium oligandrum]